MSLTLPKPTSVLHTHILEHELGIDNGVDVEIEVICGFDDESQKAIENARKAADMLYSYGFIAVVVPRVVHWDHVSHYVDEPLPIVLVNGFPVSMGKAPSPDTIIDHALAGVGGRFGSIVAPSSRRGDGGVAEAAELVG